MAPAGRDTAWSRVVPGMLSTPGIVVVIGDAYISDMDPCLRSNGRLGRPLVICEIDGYAVWWFDSPSAPKDRDRGVGGGYDQPMSSRPAGSDCGVHEAWAGGAACCVYGEKAVAMGDSWE